MRKFRGVNLRTINQLKEKTSETKSKPDIQSNIAKSDITISNTDSRYKLKFGSQFGNLLDPRDQVLEHEFNFKIPITSDYIQQFKNGPFQKSNTYVSIVSHIKQFLVEAASNVISIAFNFLTEDKLKDLEAKDYASKNMMINMQSIYRETINAIQGSIQSLYNENNQQNNEILDKLQKNLIKETDMILQSILTNIASYYPQAPAAGVTPRMRDIINQVNRVEDEESDLIYANKIQLTQHIKFVKKNAGFNNEYEEMQLQTQKYDYTKFIMKVINKIIEIVQSNEKDTLQRTNKQLFIEFNENLFWMAQQPNYQNIINKINDQQDEESNRIQKKIEDIFSSIFNGKRAALKKQIERNKEIKQINKVEEQQQHENYLEKNENKIIEELIRKSEKGIEEMKYKKKHAIGQKIPGYIKQFSRQDIQNNNFSSKHSSILRILTKWIQYLQNIFLHPEKHIMQRLYKFKTVKDELVELSQSGKYNLVSKLYQQYKEVKIKFDVLKDNYYEIVKNYMKSYEKSNHLVNRYSHTRTVASKINAVLTSMSLKYTNILIHHLLKAGSQIQSTGINADRLKNLNLVVFRISDLLRAKLRCNQSSFITLLKTLYILDGNDEMKDKFKLVRIKNKLDEPANNIMINYLFKGKIQCQLQLSIQQAEGKEKSYYAFSHFIYELTRGKFGAIAECAIMISQLDPMIFSCKEKYYIEKNEIKSKVNKIEEKELVQKSKQIQEKISQVIKQQIFSCKICKCDIINQSIHIFKQEKNQKMCNNCVLNLEQITQILNHMKQKKLHDVLTDLISGSSIKRIKNYDQLIDLYGYKILAGISDLGKLELFLVLKVESQLKTFMIKLDSKLLPIKQQMDYSVINAFDITKRLKKSRNNSIPFKQLMFQCINNIVDSKICQIMNIKQQFISYDSISEIQRLFKQFRLEKNLIKEIKFKAEIINTDYQNDKLGILEKVVEVFKINKYKIQQNTIRKKKIEYQKLKYRKAKQLNFQSITKIDANQCYKQNIFNLLKQFKNLKILSLKNNGLSSIDAQNLSKNIIDLNLGWNQINKINISSLINLTILNLRSNQIDQIDLSEMRNLTYLNLQQNRISKIDLSNLINLANLDLSQNQIAQIDISKLINLLNLNLRYNQIKIIDLTNLVKLININLRYNQLNEINVSNLINIATLYLYKNHIKEIDISNLMNLTNIDFEQNQIKQIKICGLKKLEDIDLTSNKIQIIESKNFNDLPNLQILRLSSNLITSVSLQNFANIKNIYLSNNQIVTINISNLPSLEQIDLTSNQIQIIDDQSLSNLSNLRDLKLNSNLITKVDLVNFPGLKTLALNENKITSINISNMPSLEDIDLTTNQILIIESKNFNDLPNLQILRLSSNLITSVSLQNFDNIRTIYLNNNQIVTISISNLPKVQQIYLYSNQIQLIDDQSLSNLPNLTDLKLNSNLITKVDLVNFPGLKTLALNENKITSINISNMPSLEDIDLTTNQILIIESKNFKDVPNLNILRLSSNLITSVSLQNFNNIRTIYLSRNQIVTINISNLPFLEQVSLNSNQIQFIDDRSLSNLPNLIDLKLDSNLLTKVDLVNLPALRYLSLNDNKITSINISNMTSLVDLDLTSNQIQIIESKNLKDLPNLNILRLSSNLITSVSLQNFDNIRTIYLSSNQITTISISNLPSLEQIDLTSNQIQIIDDQSLSNLPNLAYLRLSSNLITKVDLTNHPGLKILTLNDNKITSINISNMTSLRDIDLTSNQIQIIESKNFKDVPNLQILRLSSNLITSVSLQNFDNIRTIYLNNNQIVTINISNLPFVEQINLNSNQIQIIDDRSLSNLPNLADLTLNSNLITKIDLVNLPGLKTLNLNGNKLQSIDLSNLASLTSVSLEQNLITSIDLSVYVAYFNFSLDYSKICTLFLSISLAMTQEFSKFSQLKQLTIYYPSDQQKQPLRSDFTELNPEVNLKFINRNA